MGNARLFEELVRLFSYMKNALSWDRMEGPFTAPEPSLPSIVKLFGKDNMEMLYSTVGAVWAVRYYDVTDEVLEASEAEFRTIKRKLFEAAGINKPGFYHVGYKTAMALLMAETDRVGMDYVAECKVTGGSCLLHTGAKLLKYRGTNGLCWTVSSYAHDNNDLIAALENIA